ncbi:MAG: 2-oxoacid:ferredoxin oxidoreductase subunit beta [Peptococcaceae bacterium]|nr:2-oxoacid:ferredoxin oxidoreductase subunit beta [Peptococcaceae bacterium]
MAEQNAASVFDSTDEIAWCPGCGNFPILKSLKQALFDLGKQPDQVLIASGIGQAAKLPHYIKVNGFNGLHGRALPPAIAAKIVNPGLTVLVNTGDGDSYGEGGNHFLHNIRRNVDITHLVHNNQIYGLTKGQASPTTDLGQVTGVQTLGNIDQPLDPVLMAIAVGASFVARGFAGEPEHLTELIKAAIEHKGYALLDILQPCVSFNKVNTYDWYRERVYRLGDDYDRTSWQQAMAKAAEWGSKIPIGILYQIDKPTFADRLTWLKNSPHLVDRQWEPKDAEHFMQELD